MFCSKHIYCMERTNTRQEKRRLRPITLNNLLQRNVLCLYMFHHQLLQELDGVLVEVVVADVLENHALLKHEREKNI